MVVEARGRALTVWVNGDLVNDGRTQPPIADGSPSRPKAPRWSSAASKSVRFRNRQHGNPIRWLVKRTLLCPLSRSCCRGGLGFGPRRKPGSLVALHPPHSLRRPPRERHRGRPRPRRPSRHRLRAPTGSPGPTSCRAPSGRTTPRRTTSTTNSDHVYDVDQDGWPDVIAGGWGEDGIYWYRNPGRGAAERGKPWEMHQPWEAHLLARTRGHMEMFALHDYDGDGVPELHSACYRKQRAARGLALRRRAETASRRCTPFVLGARRRRPRLRVRRRQRRRARGRAHRDRLVRTARRRSLRRPVEAAPRDRAAAPELPVRR